MKKVIFKFSAFALSLVLLLCCFASCNDGTGAAGTDVTGSDEELEAAVPTESLELGGITFHYPVGFQVMTQTADMIMLMDVSSGRSISAIKTETSYDSIEDYEESNPARTAAEFISEEVAEIKEEAESMGYKDVNVELISLLDGRLASYKMEFVRDGANGDQYCTAFYMVSWNASSFTATGVVITVVDTNADRALADVILG